MGTLVGIALCVGNKRAVATAPTGIMTFADPAMQALCAQTWGDGTNITYEQAREVTEIPKNWAKGNTTITSFNEIKYFKNCRTIGASAFERCSSMALTSLELPQCKSIGNYAFHSCSSMKSIELPSTVTAIGPSAFQYCTGLTRVSITAATPPSLGSSAFANCSALTGIYVPDESIEAYKTATNWSAYANKILPLSQYNG